MLLLQQHAAAQSSGKNDVQALTAAYNASGFALFKELSARPGNIVFSPFSIGSAMAMALSGARGETEREMPGGFRPRLGRTAREPAHTAAPALLRRCARVPPGCPPGRRATGPRRHAAPRAGAPRPPTARRRGTVCGATASPPPPARPLTANALMLPGRGD